MENEAYATLEFCTAFYIRFPCKFTVVGSEISSPSFQGTSEVSKTPMSVYYVSNLRPMCVFLDVSEELAPSTSSPVTLTTQFKDSCMMLKAGDISALL